MFARGHANLTRACVCVQSMETAIYCKANDMKLVVQRCQFTNCDSGGVSARKAADVSVTHSTFAGCVTQAVRLYARPIAFKI